MKRSPEPRCLIPLTLSLSTAARYLDVPPETLRTWLKRGVFRRLKIEGRVLLLKRDIDDFISRKLRGSK